MARVNTLSFTVPVAPNQAYHWQDNSVYDADLLDPDTSGGNPSRFYDDTVTFDLQGLAGGISYYQGHGAGPIGGRDTPCTIYNTSYCSNPANTFGIGCVVTPDSVREWGGSGFGMCRYNSPQQAPAAHVCSNYAMNNNQALYSQNMAFGENIASGAWRGAATNGGVGLVIAKQSFGMWLPWASQWWPVFGGLELFAGTAVGWGDSEDSPGFGYAVANPYSVNPNASIQSGYLAAIANISDGGGCPPAQGGTSWGGGFNGCGCHAIMTMSNTASCAQTVIGESWTAMKYGSNMTCQTANGYYYWYVECNWNPGAGGWSGGP